jgi:hypothetical protein
MMGLPELAVLYAAVGAGCAVVALATGRAGDAPLLLVLWPLYGPFALARGSAGPSGRGAADPASPLGVLLPDARTMADLERRVEDGRRRAEAIKSLLSRPEFCEAEAGARLAQLEAEAAGPSALALARSRVDNIRRLVALKKRLERELEEVAGLLIQLKAQAEVVRLVGAHDPTNRELVRELASRVEGLDHMLAEEMDADRE